MERQIPADIWDVLQIEPTTDRKKIRRAYAAGSRMVHPEEKPDEFRVLYDAYQAALKYAAECEESACPSEETEAPEKEETGESKTPDAEQDVLTAFFQDRVKKQEQRADFFQEQWEKLQDSYRTKPVLKWWGEYLRSEDFQEIKWHPLVLAAFAGACSGDLKYEEFLLPLWDIYGFQEEETGYGDDAEKLLRFLRSEHDAWLLRKQKQKQEEEEAAGRNQMLVALALLFCVLVPMMLYSYLTRDQRQERSYQTGRELEEDLNTRKLFRSCAKQYGLLYDIQTVANSRVYLLYYPDYEQIDAFCGTVAEMFREHEELAAVGRVSICADGIAFPEIMMDGGDMYSDLTEKQVYSVEELLDGEELAARVRESYMVYMFNYEAWNLTEEQYRELGPLYEKLCMEWEDREGIWSSLYIGEEKICRVFIATYTDGATERSDGHVQRAESSWITVGNIWHLLCSSGADVQVLEDGSGFQVSRGEESRFFGAWQGTAEELSEVEAWY